MHQEFPHEDTRVWLDSEFLGLLRNTYPEALSLKVQPSVGGKGPRLCWPGPASLGRSEPLFFYFLFVE